MTSESNAYKPLETQYATLSLDEEEEVEFPLKEDEEETNLQENEFTLVGKLLTDKAVKFNFMKDTLASIWRPARGMMFEELSNNLFLFYFFHARDMKRVQEDGPWSFEQSLLLVKHLQPNEDPFELSLTKADFWVQVHKVPKSLGNLRSTETIGNYLGGFKQADTSNYDGTRNSFFRVRASIDVMKPLRRKMKIKPPRGESILIEFKYERFPTYCFLCGLIGHSERLCMKEVDETDNTATKPYGPELRATGIRSQPNLGQRWILTQPLSRKSATDGDPSAQRELTTHGEEETTYEVPSGQRSTRTDHYPLVYSKHTMKQSEYENDGGSD